MSKTLVLLNPVAGVGRAARLWPLIESTLRQGGLVFDTVQSEAPYQAIAIAEKAKRDGYETIVAVGGDGIIHEIVNGIMLATHGEANGTLGVIPVGSGNDFAKMIPLTPGDWQGAVQRIIAGKTRWFDVGRITVDKPAVSGASQTRYFANGLDTGFGAYVSMHAHLSILTGTAMYLVAVLRTLAKYFVPRVTIQLPGQTIKQSSTMTVVSIGRCFGGGFWLTPNALVDDGLLDVVVVEKLGRLSILLLLPKVMKGTHLGDPRVKSFRSQSVVIESPDPLAIECDGEVPWVDAHRLEIEVLPKRLRVIA